MEMGFEVTASRKERQIKLSEPLFTKEGLSSFEIRA